MKIIRIADRICGTVCELCFGANVGAVVVLASTASASWFIGRLQSANLQPRWGKRLAMSSVCLPLVSISPLVVVTLCRSARDAKDAKDATASAGPALTFIATLPFLATYVASSITMWFATMRTIDAFAEDIVEYLNALGYEEQHALRNFLMRNRRSHLASKPPAFSGCIPRRPHPLDPRADDSCPICCDDLESAALTLLVYGGRGGVRAHVATRQLSKCRRCGSVAHTECVFAMMIAGSGKPGNNPCAVCRPSP